MPAWPTLGRAGGRWMRHIDLPLGIGLALIGTVALIALLAWLFGDEPRPPGNVVRVSTSTILIPPLPPPTQAAIATVPAAAASGDAAAEGEPAGTGEAAAPAPAPEPEIALRPAPDPGLVAPSPRGPLPVIGADGRRPWQVYARPFKAPPGQPLIAIVLTELGLNRTVSEAAVANLPGAVTLAFAPYGEDLRDWVAAARADGHEVLLQLPMEPVGYPASDPGPNALFTSLTPSDNLDRLEWLLARFPGYVGVTSYMGSKFTASEADMRPLVQSLRERGLMLVDGLASPRSVAARLAREAGVAVAVATLRLDAEPSAVAIDARLAELERLARAGGAVLGLGSAYPVTVERVASWSAGLAAKGIALAPVSALVGRQGIDE